MCPKSGDFSSSSAAHYKPRTRNVIIFITSTMQTNTLTHTAKEKGDNCTGKKNMVLAFPIRKTRVRGLCLFLTLTSLINVNDFDCWHIKRRPSLIIINTKRTWDLCTPICRVNESRWPETNTGCRGGPAAQGVGVHNARYPAQIASFAALKIPLAANCPP